MILKGTWVQPYYHNLPCFDKPPMIFWTVMPCFKLFGETPLASRIPSLIAGLATLALLAIAMRPVFGTGTALFSALLLASCSRFIEFSSLCMTDMFLTFFDFAAVVCLYYATVSVRHRLLLFTLAGVCCGGAILSKGPVGLLLPTLCFGLYLVTTRQLKLLLSRNVIAAVAACLLVAMPWYLALALENGPAKVIDWFWRFNVDRFANNSFANNYPPYYMVQSFFLGFAPWSMLIPLAVAGSISAQVRNKNTQQGKFDWYMWLWVALVIGFFSISKGKINYYDLPAAPAAAAVVAIGLSRWFDDDAVGAKIVGWLFFVVLLAAGIGACVIVPNITGNNPQLWCALPLVCFAGSALTATLMAQRKISIAFVVIAATTLCATMALSAQALRAIGNKVPALTYLHRLKNEHRPFRLAMHKAFATHIDLLDHALFILGKVPDWIETDAQLELFLSQKDLCYVFVRESEFDALPLSVREKLTVLDREPYISEKLTIPFILKQRGQLTGPVPVLLVTNDTKIRMH
jgi:4-amino-4-deoxy-L-arabinose transferase-like glycosyltransferase